MTDDTIFSKNAHFYVKFVIFAILDYLPCFLDGSFNVSRDWSQSSRYGVYFSTPLRYFNYISTKLYLVTTQKKRLGEALLLNVTR